MFYRKSKYTERTQTIKDLKNEFVTFTFIKAELEITVIVLV